MADNPYNEAFKNQPKSPIRDKPIQVQVVGKRCVYVNSYRVAGGKPYVSEELPIHLLNTTLGEVLDAFSDEDIRAALAEKKEHLEYWAKFREDEGTQ